MSSEERNTDPKEINSTVLKIFPHFFLWPTLYACLRWTLETKFKELKVKGIVQEETEDRRSLYLNTFNWS